MCQHLSARASQQPNPCPMDLVLAVDWAEHWSCHNQLRPVIKIHYITKMQSHSIRLAAVSEEIESNNLLSIYRYAVYFMHKMYFILIYLMNSIIHKLVYIMLHVLKSRCLMPHTSHNCAGNMLPKVLTTNGRWGIATTLPSSTMVASTLPIRSQYIAFHRQWLPNYGDAWRPFQTV